MNRARRLRAALASVVALCSLVVVASAGAAAWQGPAPISAPAVNAGDNPLIALGASGDAAAGWWDETNTRAVIARKRAGGAWTAPMNLGAIGTPIFVFTGVDASGNVTAAFNTGAVASIATWAASASAPTLVPPLVIPGGGAFTADDLAVNAAGDAVLVGESGTDLITAYRHGFGGAWELQRWTANATSARVAINPLGVAVVVYRDAANGLWGSTRTASVDWAPAESLTSKTVLNIVPTVGIDGAGNYLTAFTYDNAGVVVVRSVLRSPGAGPQESGDLSSAAPMTVADQVKVVVNAAGASLLVWKQTGAALADSSIQARFGGTGTIWGPIEPVNDAGADTPAAAIGADGRAAVAWERENAVAGNTGQARIRAPGAAGAWGDIRNVNATHGGNYTQPSIAADGRGDFAVATAPDDGASQPVVVSAYDTGPPTVSAIALSGTLLAGDPVGLTITATDEWSIVGTPTWTFGDGTTGTGLTVSHAFANPGIFMVHVSVSDGSGNTSGGDLPLTVGAVQATLTTAKFAAKWKKSRVSGTLTVAGTAPRAGTYAIDATRGKSKLHVSLDLPVGAFSRAIKLTPKLLPGSYTVALTTVVPNVRPATREARLAAPREGVVDNAWISSARGGPPALTLVRATKLWATFHFAALPQGKVKVSWFKLGKKRKSFGSALKSRAPKVASSVGPGVFGGRYRAVLTYRGVVVAQVSVRVTPS